MTWISRVGCTRLAWLAAGLASVCAGSAMAAMVAPTAKSFSADFSRGVFDDTVLQIPKYGNGSPTFAVGGGGLRRVTDESRRYYVSTVATNFNTCNFVATLTYDPIAMPASDWARWLFFGIGSGELATSYYDEPATALYFYLNLSTNGRIGLTVDYRSGTDGVGVGLLSGFGDMACGTAGALRIEKTGDDITFSWDCNGDGVFEASQTISGFSTKFPALTDENSRLFFGTGWSVNAFTSFDVRVVPEPAALTLLALGGLAVLRRRRR